MSHKFTKTVVFALAVLLAVVPFALAQQSDRPSGAQQPGTRVTPGASSQSGMSGMPHAIFATVTDVDQKDNTVTLRMQDGEKVELKVPQTLASDLTEGDSVQVTIRKADKGMGGATSPSSPGGTTQPRPGQPRQ
jgi:hypothetical protein